MTFLEFLGLLFLLLVVVGVFGWSVGLIEVGWSDSDDWE